MALNLLLSWSCDKLNLSQLLYKSRGCELQGGGGGGDGWGKGGCPSHSQILCYKRQKIVLLEDMGNKHYWQWTVCKKIGQWRVSEA